MLHPSTAWIVCSRRTLIDPEKVAIRGDAEIRERQSPTACRSGHRSDVHRPQLALREVQRAGLKSESLRILVAQDLENEPARTRQPLGALATPVVRVRLENQALPRLILV